jgi:hypothetical protein
MRNIDSIRNSLADGIALRESGERGDQSESASQNRGPAKLRKGMAKTANRSRKDVSAAYAFTDVHTATECVFHVSSQAKLG